MSRTLIAARPGPRPGGVRNAWLRHALPIPLCPESVGARQRPWVPAEHEGGPPALRAALGRGTAASRVGRKLPRLVTDPPRRQHVVGNAPFAQLRHHLPDAPLHL